jgi:hypothetical protein
VGPERHFAPEGGGEQIVLGPAEKRRDQQAAEVQIVERLDGEADRGEQVPDPERRRQREAVDARHRHPLGVEAGDDQRGEVASAADQDEDVLGRDRRPLRASPSVNGLRIQAAIWAARRRASLAPSR